MQNLFKLISSLLRFRGTKAVVGSEPIAIENIETQVGNQILESLKSDGWIVAKQYSPLAFDKGIDFDSYALKKDGYRIDFEWTNWFEWTIKGDQEVMVEIGRRVDEQKSRHPDG